MHNVKCESSIVEVLLKAAHSSELANHCQRISNDLLRLNNLIKLSFVEKIRRFGRLSGDSLKIC